MLTFIGYLEVSKERAIGNFFVKETNKKCCNYIRAENGCLAGAAKLQVQWDWEVTFDFMPFDYMLYLSVTPSW